MEELFFIGLGVLLALIALILRRQFAAFYGQKPEEYEDSFPAFNLTEHLQGSMICEGVIYGPLGRVTSSFSADFDVTWGERSGVMDELFRYNDGSTQPRQWRLTLVDDTRFEMRADDVPGVGHGVISGSAVRMHYPIKLPESAGGHVLSCVDWMYLTPDGTVMNRSQFRKFGIKVAELIATIRPKAPE